MKRSKVLAGLFSASAFGAIALLLLAYFLPGSQTSAALPIAETSTTIAQKLGSINYSRLGIGGVRLGDSIEKANSTFGEAQRDESKPAPGLGGTIRTINYPGVSVSAFDGKIYSLVTTSSNFPTIDGVKVGDETRKVLQIYGTAADSLENGTGRLTYYNNEMASSLSFEIKNDRVQRIMCYSLLN